MGSGRLAAGQRVLCMVPESGHFITCYLLLTVVGPDDAGPAPAPAPAAPAVAGVAPGTDARTALRHSLLRRLTMTWVAFEAELRRVPVVERITSGRFTLDEYRLLLLNLRQQVMDGGRWISRAASNFTTEHFEVRSRFTRHAAEEHRDFLMIERDYAAVGGDPPAIRSQPKNVGSEAFSAWMFQAAVRENPFALAGAMFIIEGLGSRVASPWGEAIRAQLGLQREQVSFLFYHGGNDANHLAELERAIDLLPLSPALVDEIVRTARIVARLYRLQLEELGNC